MISRIFFGNIHLPNPLEATSVATKTSLTKDLNSCTALFLSSWSLSPKKQNDFFHFPIFLKYTKSISRKKLSKNLP